MEVDGLDLNRISTQGIFFYAMVRFVALSGAYGFVQSHVHPK